MRTFTIAVVVAASLAPNAANAFVAKSVAGAESLVLAQQEKKKKEKRRDKDKPASPPSTQSY
jgi:hypothetical protein